MKKIILIGDASASTLNSCNGWHVSIFEDWDNPKKIKELFGGANSGALNYAELYPYIHSLYWWYYYSKKYTPTSVKIFSDSEVTVKCGNGQYNRGANLMYWSSIDWFVKNGFDIVWEHKKRNTTEDLKKSDFFSKKIRKTIESINV